MVGHRPLEASIGVRVPDRQHQQFIYILSHILNNYAKFDFAHFDRIAASHIFAIINTWTHHYKD